MTNYSELDTGELQLAATNTRAKFNRIRHEFYNAARRYYNSSIASNAETEEKLIKLLEQCELVKEEHMAICKELKSRDTRLPLTPTEWSNNHLYFSLD